MPRRLPEEFEGQELAALCLASTPHEAEEIETVLDGAGIDYTFDITPLPQESVLGILFGSIKEGVMFLVPVERRDACVRLLDREGLSNFVVR
jgi:hypothetical protein